MLLARRQKGAVSSVYGSGFQAVGPVGRLYKKGLGFLITEVLDVFSQ